MRDDECIVAWPRVSAADVRKLARGEGADIAARLINHRDVLAPDMLSADTVRKISELSGVSADWIMGLTDEMYSAAAETQQALQSRSGSPAAAAWHRCLVDEPEEGETVIIYDPDSTYLFELAVYRDGFYTYQDDAEDGPDVLSSMYWLPVPPLPEEVLHDVS